jgi:hypothetical protein
MHAILALLLLGSPQAGPTHDKAFWREVAKAKFEVPAGETAATLAPELVGHLASPDPELRDDLAFTILTSWIYDKKLLGPEALRPLVQTLQANLRRGIATPGTDEVFRRSFSALTLSVVAARDNATPFLTPEEFASLLDASLAYLRDEQDTRGFDGRKGWVHTAAHTADLLKFLARNPKLRAVDQSRLLTAVLDKQRAVTAPLAQGEDERLARVAMSIVRREDFDRDGFGAWLTRAQAAATFPKPPTVETLVAQQNARHLLSALWTELSADERPSEGADFARTALRETIKKLF